MKKKTKILLDSTGDRQKHIIINVDFLFVRDSLHPNFSFEYESKLLMYDQLPKSDSTDAGCFVARKVNCFYYISIIKCEVNIILFDDSDK